MQQVVLGQRPGLHFLSRVLTESENQLQAGRHFASLATLQRVSPSVAGDDAELWSGWALVKIARNKLHMYQEAEANQCLSGVPAALRRAHPELDSKCFAISALMKKRAAYKLWKEGDEFAASAKLTQAVEDFHLAEVTAAVAEKPLLELNARLNIVYCMGMDSAIRRRSREDNPELVAQAMELEHQIRQWSPPATRDDVTGLAIICDLALGVGLSTADVFDLEMANAKSEARLNVLGGDGHTWPELMLAAVRTSRVRPEVSARGLILGAKALLTSTERDMNTELFSAYAIRMQAALLDIQAESQRETLVTRALRRDLQACAAAAGLRRVGIRMFR